MTIEEFDIYMDEELDKLGSDYFPLPIKFNKFKGLTLGFLRGGTEFLEASQEFSEDLQNLFIRVPVALVQSDKNPAIFTAKVPNNMFRLGSLKPFFKKSGSTFQTSEQNYVQDFEEEENTEIKKLSIIRDGQENAYSRDPYKKATPQYPQVTRYRGYYRFNFGKEPSQIYNYTIITYIKEPKFGDINNLDDNLVDLPQILIERIINKTADALKFRTSEQSAVANYQFNQRYNKNV